MSYLPFAWLCSGLILSGIANIMKLFNVDVNVFTVSATCFLALQPVLYYWMDNIKDSRKAVWLWSTDYSGVLFCSGFLVINLWPQAVNWKWITPVAAYSLTPLIVTVYVFLRSKWKK